MTEVAYCHWRKEFGGLKADQVGRLRDLETENARLRKAVADRALDKLILKATASGRYRAPRVGASASNMCDGIWPCPSAACAWRSVNTAQRTAGQGR